MADGIHMYFYDQQRDLAIGDTVTLAQVQYGGEYFLWSPIYVTELSEAIAFVTHEVLPELSARKNGGGVLTVRIMPYGRDEILWEVLC